MTNLRLFLAALLICVPAFVSAQQASGQATQYLGRVIAQTMSYHGAPWLIRPDRNKEENTDLVMQQLQLREGMTACDLGCGNGYYTLKMARQIGESGKVLAVDIQPEMLNLLKARAQQDGHDNVVPILGEIDDPNLPEGEIDLLLLVDVYHEFSHPEPMLKSIRNSLTDTGVIALLEYRMEDPTVPIKRLHKMSKTQILREYAANDLKLVREFNGLPWQHLMFFARSDSSLPEIKATRWTKSNRDDADR
ncbi:class I SAM-dependent methyltransferase [Rosistilla oblonga]|uniref:class I SAM-dependent methyltransferase n=1 Tax=Rosistilla oblonga TaxID=2527990 RepID=UPI003A96ED7A